MNPAVVMEVRVRLLDDGNLEVGGFKPTIEGVCTANLMLDRAKDVVKNIKFEIPKSSKIIAPNSGLVTPK